MELIAIIVAAVLGWKHAHFSPLALKAIGIIVLGWTTVTTVASIPYIDVTAVLLATVFRALIIGVPYAGGVLARQLSDRRKTRR